MKILCELSSFSSIEENVDIGVHWYKHHKKLPWKGVSLIFYFVKYMLTITWVNDYTAYKKRMKK